MSDNWTLVAAGPSRVHLRPEHFLDGPVVSVNRAMDIVGRGLRVDMAAFADGPGKLWLDQKLERYWRVGMVLWLSAGAIPMRTKTEAGDVMLPGPIYAKVWDQHLPASVGFRLMPHGNIPDTENEGRQRSAFTTLCAFKGILRYKPKTIRILSMDMAGPWIEGMTEETCLMYDRAHHDGLDRWKHERASMEKAINQARGEGVRVETIIPEPIEESLDGALVH